MVADDPQLATATSFLEARGIPFEVIECDPELADTAQFCAHYGYPMEQSANTIVVASKREPVTYAACVVLSTTRLDVNKAVKQRMGVNKASFAAPEATAERTGMTMGGVTPFGLPDDLPVWIDSRVMEHEWVIVGGGGRSAKLKVAPEALLAIPGAEVVEGLALAAAG